MATLRERLAETPAALTWPERWEQEAAEKRPAILQKKLEGLGISVTSPGQSVTVEDVTFTVEGAGDTARLVITGECPTCRRPCNSTEVRSLGDLKRLLERFESSVHTHSCLDWQYVNQRQFGGMWRARVPGGWLVAINDRQAQDHHTSQDYSVTAPAAALTFYPDPDHAWDGTAPA